MEGTLNVGTDLLHVMVTFTCHREWACLGRADGTWALLGGICNIFDDGSDDDDNTSALHMWGSIPRETETKPEAEAHYLPSPHIGSLCLFKFIGVVHIHFTRALKDNPP